MILRFGSRCNRNVVRIVTIGVLGLPLGLFPRPATVRAATTMCVGNCQGKAEVRVADILTMVNIALGSADPSTCASGIPSGSSSVTIDQILAAVTNAINGCPGAEVTTPTPSPSPTATTGRTATPIPAGPGLSSTITNVVIGTDGKIVVTFTLTDANGIPIMPVLAAAQNDNQGRVRFVISHIEDYTGGGEIGSTFTRYVNDINATRPAYDTKGTLQTLDPINGVYSYTFGTKLPHGFDPTHTYTDRKSVV
jgi:hypothetical protein